uniref:platelet glycoprotein 4-like isoform X1 n=1 Tax=Ciona intestinalis TaxID=7719 RepID=UPI0002B8EBCA|nr:platelet glycoprotein 4-like isoform X1 [Ciona intestinalis]|eukprot:XP_002123211.2 platelet glycoprotein 4-like isoform X1 [Ciona intestinalis]
MKASGCCGKKCQIISSGLIGAVLVVLGGILMTVFDILYDHVISKQVAVVPGTVMYNLNWYDVKTPVYRSFYLFNVTNKEEFLAQKPGKYVKPVLQEIGPYTYREFLAKDNIQYLEFNKTYPEQVYYRQTAIFTFDQERSNGSETDVVTTLNFIIALLPGLIDHIFEEGPARDAIYTVFNKLIRDTDSEILFTMTVGEYLFGFQDPLLTALLNIIAPGSDDVFGLFLLTNQSRGWRDYQVYTGRHFPHLNNEITKYRNMSELPYWFGETCNMINGTDGTMTHPFMDKSKPTYFFIDEMCRSLHAVYESDFTVEGIKGWKYSVPPEIFQSPLINEDNSCFCADLNHTVCQHSGAILVSSCYYGVPLLVSLPHFLYEDGFYSEKLVGMNPKKELHEMVLVYEPTTGMIIKTESRIQLNIYMKPNKKVKALNKIQEEFGFPLLWLNENAVLQPSEASWFSKLLYKVDDVVILLQVLICVLGAALMSLSLLCYLRCRKAYKTTKRAGSRKNLIIGQYNKDAELPTVTQNCVKF